jgi:hypothetical protein
MELYLSINMNEILLIAGKWMELVNIILSEVRFRKPMDAYCLSYVEYKPNTNISNIMKNIIKQRPVTRGV